MMAAMNVGVRVSESVKLVSVVVDHVAILHKWGEFIVERIRVSWCSEVVPVVAKRLLATFTSSPTDSLHICSTILHVMLLYNGLPSSDQAPHGADMMFVIGVEKHRIHSSFADKEGLIIEDCIDEFVEVGQDGAFHSEGTVEGQGVVIHAFLKYVCGEGKREKKRERERERERGWKVGCE